MADEPDRVASWWRVGVLIALMSTAFTVGVLRGTFGSRISALEEWRALVEKRAEGYDARLRAEELRGPR
jgi:hypothetical protein